jgi:pimeloyl-ACP methyl ester carboxylesterase
MYVNLGYAVVATDYAGLGTHFRNAFLDGPSNASDIINSVSAARAALPQLSAKWIVMGEAEGGLAALAVADKEDEIRDPNYLGAIAISALVSAKEVYDHAGNPSTRVPSLAYGIKTVFPQFQPAEILTERGIELYKQLGQICSAARGIPGSSTAEIVKPGWENNSFVLKYFDRSNFGRSHAYGPILFITGDADPAIPPTLRAQAFDRVCKEGDQVQWERYPGLDAGTVLGDSVRDQIAWIEARFAGRPATTNCS